MTQKSTRKAKSSKTAKKVSRTKTAKRINADVKAQQVRDAGAKAGRASSAKTSPFAANVICMPGLKHMEGLEFPQFDFSGLNNIFGMEKFMSKQNNFGFEKYAQEAASSGREGIEAMIKFQTTLTKGVEDILRTAATITQGAVEKQAEYAKQMMGAKTLNELSAAQNKIAKSSFDEFMAGATKLSEMSVKVLNESVAPLNDQLAKGMHKAGKMAA